MKKGQFVNGVVISHLCREGQIAEALQWGLGRYNSSFSQDCTQEWKWDLAERWVKHVRDTTLLLNVLRWRAEMDYMSLLPSMGNLNHVLCWTDPSPKKDSDKLQLDMEMRDELSSSQYFD